MSWESERASIDDFVANIFGDSGVLCVCGRDTHGKVACCTIYEIKLEYQFDITSRKCTFNQDDEVI